MHPRFLPFDVPIPIINSRESVCCHIWHSQAPPCPTLVETCPPPLVGFKTLPTENEMWAAVDRAMQFDVEDSYTDREVELVRYSWAILYYNSDVVDWLMCQITEGDANNCVTEKIRGLGSRELARVFLDDPSSRCSGNQCRQYWTCYRGAIAAPGLGGGRIFICRTGNVWPIRLEAWSTGRTDDQTCAAIHTAGVLLHELIHTCWRAAWDQIGDCELTYIVQSNFIWAMLQRYPAAKRSEYCKSAYYLGDELWYRDRFPPVG